MVRPRALAAQIINKTNTSKVVIAMNRSPVACPVTVLWSDCCTEQKEKRNVDAIDGFTRTTSAIASNKGACVNNEKSGWLSRAHLSHASIPVPTLLATADTVAPQE